MVRFAKIGRVMAAISAAAIAAVLMAAPSARAAGGGVDTAALMDTVLPNTAMHDVPLRDAVQYLRNMTNANIFVNWNALQGAGISNITPITLHLRDVTMRKILSVMLQEVSPGATLVDYVTQNVLTITTRQEANTHLVTRIYPVGDLIMTVPNFTAPTFNLQNQSNTSGVQVSSGSSGGGGGGAGSSNLFSGGTGGAGGMGNNTTQTTTQRAQALVTMIEGTVQPNIWTANGGPASIIYFNRQLVVNAPVYIQDMIGGNQ
jgi:hypothetical protein